MPLGFPLLRAPQFVQTQILNICNPQEIFILSMCSKRAYNLAKVHRKMPEKGELTVLERDFSSLEISYPNKEVKPEYERTVDGRPVNRLLVCLDISEMPDQTDLINIGGTRVPAKIEPDGSLRTFWEDRVHGIKIVTDYVTRLFNMRIDVLDIKKSSLWMVDWVTSRQESLNVVAVSQWDPLSDEEFQYILTNCKATNQMWLWVNAPANFRYTGEFQKYNVLKIYGSSWITLDNLKAMGSIEISLLESNLTSSDMNLFVKHWLAGGNRRLSFACIEMNEPDFDEIFKDLTEKIVRVPGTKTFKSLNGDVRYFKDTYEIEREDGVKASIELKINWPRDFYFFVHPATEIIN